MSLTPISTTNHSDNSGVTFVLEAMALDVSLNKGIIIDSIVDAKTLSAHAISILDISYSDISGGFQYYSDAIDVSGAGIGDSSDNRFIDGISEATDWSFNHIYTNWFNTSNGANKSAVNISDAVVDDNTKIGPFSSPPIKQDSVRHMAQSVFGSYTAVDIFQNESDLVSDVVTSDGSFNTLIKGLISDASGVDDGGDSGFLGTGNFAREIIRQILNNSFGQPKRIVADISRNHYARIAAGEEDSSGNPTFEGTGILDIPFMTNDILAIKVNYGYPDTTSIVTGSEVPNRSYVVKLRITGDTPYSHGASNTRSLVDSNGVFLI